MNKKIVFILAAIVPVLLFAIFINNTFATLKHHNIQMNLANDETQVQKIEAEITQRLVRSERDLAFLLTYFNQIKPTKGHENFSESIQPQLVEILPAFSKANPLYQKILIIDDSGSEISFDRDTESFSTERKNKAEIDYFKEAAEHKLGNAHMFFEGKSLTIARPIQDESGVLQGVLSFSLDSEDLIEALYPEDFKNKKIMVVADNGEYLINSKPGSREFSLDYSPEVFTQVRTIQSGYLELEKNKILTFMPVQLDDLQWFLLIENDKEILNHEITVLEWQLKGLFAIVFLFIAILIALRFAAVRRELQAEQLRQSNDELEILNAQLVENQTALEEQTAVVEELNALLEEDVVRIEEQKDLLNAITDSIKWGIAFTDPSNETLFINKLWRKYFPNYSPSAENLCGFGQYTDAKELIDSMVVGTENSEDVYRKLLESLGNFKDSYRLELIQTESHRHLRVKSLPCLAKNGRVIGRILVCSDITRYKEIDRLKSELISTVSHELRTPMSSIMGFSELLLTRELSQERARKYIEIIHNQAHRLTQLISDFLDIQRIQSGKLVFNKERVSMDEVIHQALDLFEEKEGYHVIFRKETEREFAVEADFDKVVQVISNLLSNAIKYSPQGGEILVGLSVEKEVLKVEVTDHGLGIPSEALPKLFTKFFRVDNDDRRKIGGTGLGLAICKEIIVAHGGEIWVESTFGQGSSFYFTLPLLKDNPLVQRNSQSEVIQFVEKDKKPGLTQDGEDMILLVEDDHSFAQLMQEILHQEGYKTLNIDNGIDAIKAVKKRRFKMVILDIVLQGDLTGWDVLKALKADPHTASLPVIISSIYEHKKLQKDGIQEYLPKPFKPEDLLKVVKKVAQEELDSKMMMYSSKEIQEYVVTFLKEKGIKVKDCQLSEEILLITLDGENE